MFFKYSIFCLLFLFLVKLIIILDIYINPYLFCDLFLTKKTKQKLFDALYTDEDVDENNLIKGSGIL